MPLPRSPRGVIVKYVINLQTPDPARRSASIDYRLEDAPPAARSVVEIWRLRPGLILNVARLAPHNVERDVFDIDQGPVQFGFTVAGHNRCSYANGRLAGQSHELTPGCNSIFHLSKTKGNIDHAPDKDMCVVGVMATPEFLGQYLGDAQSPPPKLLWPTLDGRADSQFAWYGRPHPRKDALVRELLSHPHQGGLERMRLEGLVLQLVGGQLAELAMAERQRPTAAPLLRGDDLERVGLARRILLQRAEDPPSLRQLAREAGLNEKKLKYGFRQVFGTSVFAYLRDHRLETAKGLLESGRMNVSEAAFCVGYASLSHFSRAFKRRFGLNPSDCLQAPPL